MTGAISNYPSGSRGDRGSALRSEVRIIREGDEERADAAVVLVDGRTGQRHRFTEAEYFLCQGGTGDLMESRRRYRERFGRDVAIADIVELFRRLRALDLFDDGAGSRGEPAAADRPTSPTLEGMAVSRRKPLPFRRRPDAGDAAPAGEPATSVADAGPAEGSASAAAEPLPARPLPARPRPRLDHSTPANPAAAPSPTPPPEEAGKPAEEATAKPLGAPASSRVAGPAPSPVSAANLSEVGNAASRQDLGEPGESVARVGRNERRGAGGLKGRAGPRAERHKPDKPGGSAHHRRRGEAKSAPREDTAGAEQESLGGGRPAKRASAEALAASPPALFVPDDDESALFSPDELDDFAAGLDDDVPRQFRGGGGGEAFGGGGRFAGRRGRGGAGGGGQGGPRGEILKAIMASRGGGAGALAEDQGPDRPASIRLFNPSGLFSALAVVFWPLKFLHYLIIPAVILAALTGFQRWDDLVVQSHKTAGQLSSVAHLVISLLVINLGTRLAFGTTVRAFGGEVRSFGIMLVLGFIPRFYADRSGVRRLDRKGQLWSFGAPIMARLWFFAAGMIVWAAYRQSGTWLPQIALLVSQTALLLFLIECMPLLPSDGYRWLATYIDQPNLKRKAIATLRAKMAGRPLPPSVRPDEVAGLMFFAAASLLAIAGVVLFSLIFVSISLEEQFNAPMQLIFLGLFGLFIFWLLALRTTMRRRRAKRLKPAELQLLFAGQMPEPEPAAETRPSASKRGRVVWAVLAVALLSVAFLPYQYEASGTFQVMPVARTTATARTEGEVVKVLVREGDWVEANQVVAQLSSWDQQRDVDVTRAELAKAKAKLAELEAGPKPEEVALAERQVESAQSRVTFDKAEADRAAQLVKSGTISQKEWERANTSYETAAAELDVAKANLELVKSGPTESEIDAAKAEVERLSHQLTFYEDQLERTRVRAPAPGRVITPNVELSGGKWLETGDEFLQLDDTRVVQAEIDVPETDIGLIRPGDRVRVKAWGYSDRELVGEVTEISPAAETRDYGQVVRVKASIPNADALLRPGMSGYAKIDGQEMRVWEAYLRFFTRFFTVEVWSWIP